MYQNDEEDVESEDDQDDKSEDDEVEQEDDKDEKQVDDEAEHDDDKDEKQVDDEAEQEDDKDEVWQDVSEESSDIQTEINKEETTNIDDDKRENPELYESPQSGNLENKGKVDTLEEYDFDVDKSNTMEINNHKEVYKSIYKEAKEKALKDRKQAMESLFELRKIKNLYMIDDEDLEFV